MKNTPSGPSGRKSSWEIPGVHKRNQLGAIHSTKISGNFGLKLNGSVRSKRKRFEKNRSTFRGGPLFSVGPVRSKLTVPVAVAVATSQAKCMFWLLTAFIDDLFAERIWHVFFVIRKRCSNSYAKYLGTVCSK